MNKNIVTIFIIIGSCAVLGIAFMIYSNYKAYNSLNTKQIEQSQGISTKNEDKSDIAPDFALKDMNGKIVKLSDYRDKIVILNFWTVWCKYCKEEMPDLNELNKEFEKEGNVVILAVDSQESRDVVEGYLIKEKITLNVLLDEDGSVTQKYGVTGFPTTIIINKDGTIVDYIPHLTTKEDIVAIVSSIH